MAISNSNRLLRRWRPPTLCLHGFRNTASGDTSCRRSLSKVSKPGPQTCAVMEIFKAKGVSAYGLDLLVEDVAGIIQASGCKQFSSLMIGEQLSHGTLRSPITTLSLGDMQCPSSQAMQKAFGWEQMKKAGMSFSFNTQYQSIYSVGTTKRVGDMIRNTFVDLRNFLRIAEVFSATRINGALTAMINYYRALMKQPNSKPKNEDFPIIKTPTLMMWGRRCLIKRNDLGTERT